MTTEKETKNYARIERNNAVCFVHIYEKTTAKFICMSNPYTIHRDNRFDIEKYIIENDADNLFNCGLHFARLIIQLQGSKNV